MNSFLLTIIEEVPAATATATGINGFDTIRHLELRLPGPLDIPRIVAVLTEQPPKPRAPRKDRGKPRKGGGEPQLI